MIRNYCANTDEKTYRCKLMPAFVVYDNYTMYIAIQVTIKQIKMNQVQITQLLHSIDERIIAIICGNKINYINKKRNVFHHT